jgi:glycosyltransferase involved in cell wall biosynthesis
VASDLRPELTIVISTLGNHGLLRRVLDGYERQHAPAISFEVLVVADCAEPDPGAVQAAVGERPYEVRVLSGSIPGLSANRNVGWDAARAPVVLFTDNDTIPVPALVREHLSWHRRWPAEEVAVAGLVRWAKGLKVTPFMRWLERGLQFDFHSIPGSEASWAHLYGANSSIKRALLERVGGYDERRLPYGYEDLDWGYRAREHGLRVLLNRRAVVDHWRPMTVNDWQVRAPRLAVSEWRFCQLHPDVPPWFQRKFADAAALPPGGRRSAAALRFVPEGTPWLGRRLASRADLYWRQQIAQHFLAAWDAAAAGNEPELRPAAAAFAERSS